MKTNYLVNKINVDDVYTYLSDEHKDGREYAWSSENCFRNTVIVPVIKDSFSNKDYHCNNIPDYHNIDNLTSLRINNKNTFIITEAKVSISEKSLNKVFAQALYYYCEENIKQTTYIFIIERYRGWIFYDLNKYDLSEIKSIIQQCKNCKINKGKSASGSVIYKHYPEYAKASDELYNKLTPIKKEDDYYISDMCEFVIKNELNNNMIIK